MVVSRIMERVFVLTTFFDGDPGLGGGYTQRRKTLDVLKRLQSASLKVIVICSTKSERALVEQYGLVAVRSRRSFVRKIICRLLALNSSKRLFGRWIPRLPFTLDAQLRRLRTDLVLFIAPDGRALELVAHNFVFPVYDVCHLDHPEFPEVSHYGEFERRQYLFNNVLQRAVAVTVDSSHGKYLVEQRYQVDSSRCHVVPFSTYDIYANFSPDPVVLESTMQRYGVSQPYVFYPAQFWPHKNHKYILDALKLMAKRGDWVPQVVFCGSDKGALAPVQRYASDLGVAQHVAYCGFVPNEDLPYLYVGALALVMPTYFGPTNIPPMEAVALGVPVCYSDFDSFREQLGDDASYMDLKDPSSLVRALDSIRSARSHAGVPAHSRRQMGGKADDVYLKTLQTVIADYRRKLIGG